MQPYKMIKKEIEDVDDEPLKSRQIKVLKNLRLKIERNYGKFNFR